MSNERKSNFVLFFPPLHYELIRGAFISHVYGPERGREREREKERERKMAFHLSSSLSQPPLATGSVKVHDKVLGTEDSYVTLKGERR